MKIGSKVAVLVGVGLISQVRLQAAPPVLLDEGFEAGAMPPAGWTQSILNADYTWEVVLGGAHSGTYSAWADWEPEPFVPQNEWLVSPAFSVTGATLTFWSIGDVFWCRDVHNGCELFIWIVVGEVGGGDDVMVGKADDDWAATDVWSKSTFDLTPFLPAATPVKIGFNFMGWVDRDAVGLDDILLMGEGTQGPIFLDGFESGDLSAWSDSLP